SELSLIRLYVTSPLLGGPLTIVDPGQAHYLATVMRLKAGDELQLFNGRDGEWRARVATASKRTMQLEVLEQTRSQSQGPDLDLVVALVKRGRLETIVE